MEISFSKNLKNYLDTHNLSLKDLGQKLNVPTSTVHGWINGIPPRSIVTLKKIASLLECTIDELCFDEVRNQSTKGERNESNMTIVIDEEKYQVVLVKMKSEKNQFRKN
jgi:putative transcriptional regulator